jgi:hypothetical protein
VGSVDLPHGPEESGQPEHGSEHREALQETLREAPDPGERGRVYDATRAYVEAHRPASYWAEVPRLLRLWTDHDERWAAEWQARAGAERPPDAPGAERGFYHGLEPDLGAADAIGRLREGEPPISADVRATERENASGGRLEGFEFRLKGDDRLKEKIAEQLKAEPDKTPSEVLHKIPDAIRYTFCFPPDAYTRGYYDIKASLESHGHEMYLSSNSWGDREYKGINTRWVTPEGRRFEVQFHTPESFHAKHYLTHGSYERIRDPMTSRRELRELHSYQREVSSQIPVPDGAAEIPDHKKEGF